jgi:hypothetical protein
LAIPGNVGTTPDRKRVAVADPANWDTSSRRSNSTIIAVVATGIRGRRVVRIIPRFAWKLQGLGVLLFGALLAGSLLVSNPSRFTFFGPIEQLLYVLFFVVTLALCLRPPGVILRENEMVVRRFGRSRHIERRNVREVLFELPTNAIGAELRRSKYRHVEIVVWENGIEHVIPIVWCDRLMGLMTPQEAQEAKATLDAWTGRTGTN